LGETALSGEKPQFIRGKDLAAAEGLDEIFVKNDLTSIHSIVGTQSDAAALFLS
jgi:hypothetical protein